MLNRRTIAGILVLAGLAALALLFRFNDGFAGLVRAKLLGRRTLGDALEEYGPGARERLAARFDAAGVRYPPAKVRFAVLKDARQLEVWALEGAGWRFVQRYRVLGASGHAGPKLREGDRQVPEGLYRVAGLNPNSAYHLSIELNYPNELDRLHAAQDGRTNLGDDIFIHGSDASIGCLAMGDSAIEELFVLTADVGPEEVTVLIAPTDPRTGPLPLQQRDAPSWLPELYRLIAREFEGLR